MGRGTGRTRWSRCCHSECVDRVGSGTVLVGVGLFGRCVGVWMDGGGGLSRDFVSGCVKKCGRTMCFLMYGCTARGRADVI